jgi:L-lactate dehydrogenase
MRVEDVLVQRRIALGEFRQTVEHDVRFANISIIEGIGASQYGIGMVAARLAEVVLRDEQAVVPVSSHNARYDVTVSLPSVVGRSGVNEVLWPEMSDDEKRALEHSVEILRTAVAKYVKTN